MEESILSFFEQWRQEFARAVEMFSGETPALTQKPVGNAEKETWETRLGDFTWWEQQTEGQDRFKVWVGAEEPSWTELGGGQSDGSDPKDLFQEMVAQANQGAAAVLSATFKAPIRFAAVSINPPSGLSMLELADVRATFHEKQLSLLVAIESAAARILDGPEPEPAPPMIASPHPQAITSSLAVRPNPPMLDRLMDLHLPVSVLLGQSVMTIREALKLSSGSVVELDRQLGDYVEVVVHGMVVAKGEIVAVKGNYGVRIKEVISRQDRLALKDVA